MFIRTLRNLESQELGFPLQDRLQVSVALDRGYRPRLATLVPCCWSEQEQSRA